MTEVPALRKILKNFNRYRAQPIPTEIDDHLRRLVRARRQGDPSALVAASHLEGRLVKTLLAFAERSASLAVREESEEFILDGLTALAILDPLLERANFDVRDLSMRLGPLLDAARRVAPDPRRPFLEAAESAGRRAADLMRAFAANPPDFEPATEMGYEVVNREDGFTYVWT